MTDEPRGYSRISLGPEATEELLDIYAAWLVARLTLLVLRDEASKDGPLAIAEINKAAAELELTRFQMGGAVVIYPTGDAYQDYSFMSGGANTAANPCPTCGAKPGETCHRIREPKVLTVWPHAKRRGKRPRGSG